ncbi:YpjCB family protein, partial [Pseudomonas aeruginosa]|uniref:YpjCB family protein n=1 Tax=Pseudomonas aeruginosa TaxID=287 RepID=UPI001968AAC4
CSTLLDLQGPYRRQRQMCIRDRCIFNAPAYNKSNEKSLKPVSENGLSGVLTDRNNKIKLITGVAPFDDILFMDDDFDDSSS